MPVSWTSCSGSGPPPIGACWRGAPKRCARRRRRRPESEPQLDILTRFLHANRYTLRSKTLPSHQLVGEIGDGLAVDRRVVPFAHGLEICRAFAVRRTHLEAVGVQQ